MTHRSSSSTLALLSLTVAVAALAACTRTVGQTCDNCPEGFTCVGDVCLLPCRLDADCGPTASCGADGYCQTQCQVGTDCPAHPTDQPCLPSGALCRFGLCHYPGACAAGQHCDEITSRCSDTCDTFRDCAHDQACVDQACVGVADPACASHDGCSDQGLDAECWEGRCRQPCELDEDCRYYQALCDDNLCNLELAPDCDSDGDCSTTVVCLFTRGFCKDGHCAFSRRAPGADCNDGLACTGHDACDADGACAGEVDCDDPPEAYCRADLRAIVRYQALGSCSLSGSGQCEYGTYETACEGGTVCTDNAVGVDASCVNDRCIIDGQSFPDGTANPADPCQRCASTVSTSSWTPLAENEACDDGRYCTVNTRCLSGSCTGSARDCCTQAGISCSGCRNVWCDEGDDSCHSEAAGEGEACNDGLFCTAGTTCQTGTCTGGGAYTCADTLPACAVFTACLEAEDRCSFTVQPGWCLIGGACHAAGSLDPANGCRACLPAVNPLGWSDRPDGSACELADPCLLHDRCDKGQCVGDPCPLGCADTPARHCVEPSNWGYWSGTTANRTGITLAWIEGSSGGAAALTYNDDTVLTINSDNGSILAGALTLPISSSAEDRKLVAQRSYHAGSLPPGITSASDIPDLQVFKFKSISLGPNVRVNCIGARPVALVSAGPVSVGGTWDVRCGAMGGGYAGASAGAAADQFATRGGGGGGHGGVGGFSGAAGDNVAGGPAYGANTLQPLLPGAGGGAGRGAKALDESELSGHTSSTYCWWSHDEGCNVAPFSTWKSNTFNALATPNPAGGAGGGALQLVSLTSLTVTGTLAARGQGGGGLAGCAERTPAGCAWNACTYNGAKISDYHDYPLKDQELYQGSGAGCPGTTACEDGPGTWAAHTRRWQGWVLQSGGGGGGGGALLLEAPAVSIASAARVLVDGGGGGAGCYSRQYGRYMELTASPWNYEGPLTCYMEPSTQAGPGSAPGTVVNPASGTAYPALGGAAGGSADNGANRSTQALNSNNDDCISPAGYYDVSGQPGAKITNDPVNFPQNPVAWGGGGGGAGRVRVNTPAGTVTCTGTCGATWQQEVFAPDPGTLVQIGRFPSSGQTAN